MIPRSDTGRRLRSRPIRACVPAQTGSGNAGDPGPRFSFSRLGEPPRLRGSRPNHSACPARSARVAGNRRHVRREPPPKAGGQMGATASPVGRFGGGLGSRAHAPRREPSRAWTSVTAPRIAANRRSAAGQDLDHEHAAQGPCSQRDAPRSARVPMRLSRTSGGRLPYRERNAEAAGMATNRGNKPMSGAVNAAETRVGTVVAPTGFAPVFQP
jgi:hypothetical protein